MTPRLPRLLIAILLAVLAPVLAAPAARADQPADWRITRYAIDARFRPDGSAHVRSELTFDLGATAGHGPYLVFATQQAVRGDEEHWRRIRYENVRVTSADAPATVAMKEDNGVLTLRIGDEDRTITGSHTYVIDYELRGVVTEHDAATGLGHVSWTPMGSGFELPIDEALVSVTLPGEIQASRCWVADQERGCTQQRPGRDTVVTTAALERRQKMHVDIAVPAGTFRDVPIELRRRLTGRSMAPHLPNLVSTAIVLALGGGALALTRRRPDSVYANVAPGVRPGRGAPVEPAPRQKPPVAVRFSPPDCRALEIHAVYPGASKDKLLTVTLLDMAARGDVIITRELGERGLLGRRRPRWRLDRQPVHVHREHPVEAALTKQMFKSSSSVTTADLAASTKGDESLGRSVARAVQKAAVAIPHEHGWYQTDGSTGPVILILIGIVGMVLGTGWTVLAAMAGINILWPGLAAILVGVTLVTIAVLRKPSLTAEGSAVAAQAEAFRHYLKTAEADQIQWEEGVDIYSRYLPWAVALGVADHWTGVFRELATQGRYDLSASTLGALDIDTTTGGLASGSFASSFSSSISAATTDSSSSSGGGDSGGGGGGGGGGW